MTIDPNIVNYRVVGSFVVGEREKPSLIDDPRLSSDFGYFILDTETGEVVSGLNRTQFESALRAKNLPLNLF